MNKAFLVLALTMLPFGTLAQEVVAPVEENPVEKPVDPPGGPVATKGNIKDPKNEVSKTPGYDRDELDEATDICKQHIKNPTLMMDNYQNLLMYGPQADLFEYGWEDCIKVMTDWGKRDKDRRKKDENLNPELKKFKEYVRKNYTK